MCGEGPLHKPTPPFAQVDEAGGSPKSALGGLRVSFGGGVCGRLVEMAILPCTVVVYHIGVDVRRAKKDNAEDASVSVGGLILDADFLAEDERL